MECPRKRCDGALKVTNSYSAGPGKTTQRRQCDRCSYSCVTQIAVVPTRLTARALAKELRNGR